MVCSLSCFFFEGKVNFLLWQGGVVSSWESPSVSTTWVQLFYYHIQPLMEIGEGGRRETSFIWVPVGDSTFSMLPLGQFPSSLPSGGRSSWCYVPGHPVGLIRPSLPTGPLSKVFSYQVGTPFFSPWLCLVALPLLGWCNT